MDYEALLIRHEGCRDTPYIDSLGVQTIGSNMLPSFIMDNPVYQHVAYSIFPSETPLRFSLGMAMSDVSNLIFGEFRHWAGRSLLAFLQTVSVGVKLIVSLRGILKILKRIIQLVPIAVIHSIKLMARSYKCLSDESVYCCLDDFLLTVDYLRERYPQISSITDKRTFESISLAPARCNVHHTTSRTDSVQSFISNNGLPCFHHRISYGIA